MKSYDLDLQGRVTDIDTELSRHFYNVPQQCLPSQSLLTKVTVIEHHNPSNDICNRDLVINF